ncbi:predicted protein [Alistipes sp. CAG:157]|nr:predicted protein [Alistipes sp. CAG:157]
MEIPKQVQIAAKGLIDMYGYNIDYLGKYEGAEYYMFVFPDDEDSGFPFVYQYKHGKALIITGFAALDIIDLFIEKG